MIKRVYCSRNVKSGNFNVPRFEDFDQDEARERYEITFKELPDQAKEHGKELEMYYLGEYDTKTGKFNSIEPVYIISGLEVLGD